MAYDVGAVTTDVINLTVPIPPSVNLCYRIRAGGHGLYLTEEGRAYKETVHYLTKEALAGTVVTPPVEVTALVYWPNDKRRDLDNLLKLLGGVLYHLKGLLAKPLDEAFGHDRSNSFDQARSEVSLDSLDCGRDNDFVSGYFKLLAVFRMNIPGAFKG